MTNETELNKDPWADDEDEVKTNFPRLRPLVPRALGDQLESILSRSMSDFAANNRKRFTDEELTAIQAEAFSRFEIRLTSVPVATSADLASAWQSIIEDFYANDYWGFGNGQRPVLPLVEAPAEVGVEAADEDEKQLIKFLRTALFPTLVTKSFIIYFGLNYTIYPGEGYGWGLLFSVLFTLSTFAYFVFQQLRRPTAEN